MKVAVKTGVNVRVAVKTGVNVRVAGMGVTVTGFSVRVAVGGSGVDVAVNVGVYRGATFGTYKISPAWMMILQPRQLANCRSATVVLKMKLIR